MQEQERLESSRELPKNGYLLAIYNFFLPGHIINHN